ncbi:hypothetical protein HNQ91_004957 [Filimonas zeae]|uniref:Lipoprotein n=1 Tax=Filimonas zeae TaxID=1737353 RepID=A0A917MYQ2_9BACT|nr:hypothetical protein [Filimonas zeae]MDR6341880.1 hypothetical protein [Filimonas zeae]GGH79976.1 hypothetical protein GCM10011379_50160 [Filimonas zeae]
MKIVRIILGATALILATIAISCKSKSGTTNDITTYDNDSLTFYPFHGFLQSQIADVVKTPYFIYTITQQEGKRDSVVISSADFAALTTLFVAWNIDSPAFKKYYREDAFNDASTNSVTLSYSTQNKRLPVQQADVLLEPETQRVKRIFLQIIQNRNDTTFLYKLGWKANKSCSIAKSILPGKGRELSSHTSIVWNE